MSDADRQILVTLFEEGDVGGIQDFAMRLSGEMTFTRQESNPNQLPDELADILTPGDVPVYTRAIKTTGDGNCLFHATSLGLSGDESLSSVLRLLTACELYLYPDFYTKHPKIDESLMDPDIYTNHCDTLFAFLLSDEGDDFFQKTKDKMKTIKLEGRLTLTPKRWCSLLHAMALTSVINRNIFMVYPDCNKGIRPLLNGYLIPRGTQVISFEHTLFIIWSRDGSLDNTHNAPYQPNHFVYLFKETTASIESKKRKNEGLKGKNDPMVQIKKQKTVQSKINTLFQRKESSTTTNSGDSKSVYVDSKEDFCGELDPNSTMQYDDVSEPTHDTPSDNECIDESKHEASIDDTCQKEFGGLNEDTYVKSTTSWGFSVMNQLCLNDETKFSLIKNRVPPNTYIFPGKKIKDKSKKTGFRTRSCQHQWFNQFDFISYSIEEDGLYCLPCVLFPEENTPGGRPELLITKAYSNWKDAINDLKHHASCAYHRTSITLMENFVKTCENVEARVDYILDKRLKERVAKNRNIPESIIRCIEFCGRQGIALRSHRDDETIKKSDDIDKAVFGNLKELLKLCSDLGDTTLKEHLDSCAKNASYTSKTSQNELLSCIKTFIQAEIVSKIQKQPHGPFFGIHADESTDNNGKEQLGIVLRYLDNDQPSERLIEFVECENTTGEAIAEKIVNKVHELGLSMVNCRSQSYDSAGNMAGIHKGCTTRIQQRYPNAKYYYCMNHDLNLAVSKSCRVKEMQMMMENTKQLGIFFKYSPKRQTALEDSLTIVNSRRKENELDEIKSYSMKTLCETRWVERHTTLQHLRHTYEAVIHCLTTISTRRTGTWDAKSVTEANGLMTQLTSTTWMVPFCVNLHFSGYLRSLSLLLQGPTLNIIKAHEKINLVKNELKQIRENYEVEFKDVWGKASDMAESVEAELTMPRICGKQTLNRNNVTANNGFEYWMRALFLPYLDHLIMEFESRFNHSSETSRQTLCVLPSNLHLLTDESINLIEDFFKDDLPSRMSLRNELRLWKREWAMVEDKNDLPKTIENTIQKMNVIFYPNISVILRLLLMLPVSAATIERGHSSLKSIKTKQRTTIGEERLNALILLYIHKDILLNYGRIIDMYARRNPRKMKLINPLEDTENETESV